MNSSNYDNTNPQSRQDLILLKLSGLGCGLLLCIGLLVFTVSMFQTVSKTTPDGTVNSGETQKELATPPQPSEQSQIIIKKPQKPIIVEEGSEAFYCLQNNGGDGCLNRDRFAPNFKVIAPPRPQRTYEDYLVQYGVRESGNCGRYFNGQPNCI